MTAFDSAYQHKIKYAKQQKLDHLYQNQTFFFFSVFRFFFVIAKQQQQ